MNAFRIFITRRFPKGGLKHSVSILAGGTVVAQAVAFAVSPILTRIYHVDDFGYLQIFNSIVAVLLVVVAGRYEMAIPLPEDDSTAVNLLGFALCMVLGTSSVIAIAVVICPFIPWVVAHSGKLLGYLWLIPICLAGAGFYQCLSYWSLRKKQFSLVARTRVIQVASRFAVQLGAALLKFGMPGLLFGETIARANGTGAFVRGFVRGNRPLLAEMSWRKMSNAARRYKHFPLVFSASGLLNTATLAVPGLMLVALFGPTVTGWFALVDRVLGIPSVLIGQSLQQVYVSEGAPLIHSDPVGLKHLFEKMIRKIYFIPIATCTFLTIFGPTVFAFVFGENWREAGEYARMLAFVDIVGLLVAPIELTLTMLELQNWRFAWDGGRLILVTGAMLVTHQLLPGARPVICAYAASMMLGYGVLLAVSYTAINRLIARTAKLPAQTNSRA
jgi:O-antigen/teichoic acid export membrane protein